MPTVTLVDVQGNKRHVCTKYIKSFFAISATTAWHVHPELVQTEKDGRHSANLCPTCATAATKDVGAAPNTSIAGGRDFGLLSRINVELPTEVEEMALADVRTYSMVAKVHVPGMRTDETSRTVLRGHFIAFVHDGPQVLGKHFDEARVKGVLENVQLVFVGAEGKITQLERRALAFKGLQLRPHVLYNHLALRKALGGIDNVPLPTVSDIAGWLASWTDQIAKHARWVADDSVEKASAPSDVANVRDVAMDNDHAAELNAVVVGNDATQDEESALNLDPVGVFLHSSEAVAGGIFAGIQDLLQCRVDSAMPEDPGDGQLEPGQGDEEKDDRPADNETNRRKCTRARQPMNEYTHNSAEDVDAAACSPGPRA